MTIEEVDVFFPRPHALVVDPNGRRFFAASLGQNSVAWAPIGDPDVDLMEVDGMMNHMLVQFAVSPDGRRMVGGGQMTGDLLVFDLTGDTPEVVESSSLKHPLYVRHRSYWPVIRRLPLIDLLLKHIP